MLKSLVRGSVHLVVTYIHLLRPRCFAGRYLMVRTHDLRHSQYLIEQRCCRVHTPQAARLPTHYPHLSWDIPDPRQISRRAIPGDRTAALVSSSSLSESLKSDNHPLEMLQVL